MYKRQGHHLALDAIELLGDSAPHVIFAGSPPPGQEHFAISLDAEIRERGLQDRVTRIPFTDELPSLLAAADVCLVPSTRPEPFGLVAIEAMAVGTPVIGADHGGLQEIIEDGVTGALFEPCSPASLAATVERLLSNREQLSSMGTAARERQQELFSHESYASAMLKVYESLTAPWALSAAA